MNLAKTTCVFVFRTHVHFPSCWPDAWGIGGNVGSRRVAGADNIGLAPDGLIVGRANGAFVCGAGGGAATGIFVSAATGTFDGAGCG